jgi:hypothetical protein
MTGYGTDEGFAAWLAANGYTLPDGALSPAILRTRGSAYLDAVYGPRLTCSAPTGGIDQDAAWPRTGHLVNGNEIPPDVIPAAWVRASYRAAWLEGSSPGSLSLTVNPNQRVKRQKVGEVEREFFDGGGSEAGAGGLAVIDAEIDGMVAPLLCNAVGFPAIMVV